MFTIPPPCLLPLHILRPAGLLLPLFLPQDIVNAPADLLGLFHFPFQCKIPPIERFPFGGQLGILCFPCLYRQGGLAVHHAFSDIVVGFPVKVVGEFLPRPVSGGGNGGLALAAGYDFDTAMVDCHGLSSFLRVVPPSFCAERHKTPSARPHIPHLMWYISAPYLRSQIRRIIRGEK